MNLTGCMYMYSHTSCSAHIMCMTSTFEFMVIPGTEKIESHEKVIYPERHVTMTNHPHPPFTGNKDDAWTYNIFAGNTCKEHQGIVFFRPQCPHLE